MANFYRQCTLVRGNVEPRIGDVDGWYVRESGTMDVPEDQAISGRDAHRNAFASLQSGKQSS